MAIMVVVLKLVTIELAQSEVGRNPYHAIFILTNTSDNAACHAVRLIHNSLYRQQPQTRHQHQRKGKQSSSYLSILFHFDEVLVRFLFSTNRIHVQFTNKFLDLHVKIFHRIFR